jgi:hypothetical protein
MSELILNKGLECRCDGCRRKIKAKDIRETMSGISEGQPFIKTLCEVCIKEIVEKFRAHLKEKEETSELSKVE